MIFVTWNVHSWPLGFHCAAKTKFKILQFLHDSGLMKHTANIKPVRGPTHATSLTEISYVK